MGFRSRALLFALAAVAGAILGPVGCGDQADEGAFPTVAVDAAAADTEFARALDELGSGAIPIGTGYGWIGSSVLSREAPAGLDLRWAARALGPGGDDLLRDRAAIARRTGVDLGEAHALLASAASYTLGVRADGVNTARLRPALRREARAQGRSGGWELFALGPVSSIPFGTVGEVFGPFGPRLAVGDRAVAVARRDQSRRDLMGIGASPLDDPAVAVALACLGDVIAARIIPNNFTHAPNSGPELLAFGVARTGAGPVREVLCASDPDPADAEDAAAELADSLAAGKSDPVTGEPLEEEIATAEIQLLEGEGASAAQALIDLASKQPPGFLFGAFVRGSLITYFGVPGPPDLPP